MIIKSKKKIEEEVDIEVTPKFMANAFWEMNCCEQAKFLNLVGKIIKGKGWEGIKQINFICADGGMDKYGREFIEHMFMTLNPKWYD